MNTEDIKKVFAGQQYINVETYRKNGQAVPTPVWFIEDGGVLYVRTVDGSGKVKRARRNPVVRVAVCNASGKVSSEWYAGKVAFATQAEAEKVLKMLNQKYGLVKRLFDLMGIFQRRIYTTLAIRLDV